jgi:hypothetical protein
MQMNPTFMALSEYIDFNIVSYNQPN